METSWAAGPPVRGRSIGKCQQSAAGAEKFAVRLRTTSTPRGCRCPGRDVLT